MRIAVTYENGTIFQHFGHTQQFKLYDVDAGTITASRVVDAGAAGTARWPASSGNTRRTF